MVYTMYFEKVVTSDITYKYVFKDNKSGVHLVNRLGQNLADLLLDLIHPMYSISHHFSSKEYNIWLKSTNNLMEY